MGFVYTIFEVKCHNQVHKFDPLRNALHFCFIQLVTVQLDEQVACEAFEGVVSQWVDDQQHA